MSLLVIMTSRETETAVRRKSKTISDKMFPDELQKDIDFRIKFYPKTKNIIVPKWSTLTVDTNIVICSPRKFSMYIKPANEENSSKLQYSQNNIILKTTGHLRPDYNGRLKVKIINKRNFDVILANHHLGFVICTPYV